MMHVIYLLDTINEKIKILLIDKDLKNIIEADNEPYIDIEKVVDDIVNDSFIGLIESYLTYIERNFTV